MFQCIPAMNILYFGQFNSLCYSPVQTLPDPHYLVAFGAYHYVLHRVSIFLPRVVWTTIILFSVPPILGRTGEHH
jgi:hypothetical protein